MVGGVAVLLVPNCLENHKDDEECDAGTEKAEHNGRCCLGPLRKRRRNGLIARDDADEEGDCRGGKCDREFREVLITFRVGLIVASVGWECAVDAGSVGESCRRSHVRCKIHDQEPGLLVAAECKRICAGRDKSQENREALNVNQTSCNFDVTSDLEVSFILGFPSKTCAEIAPNRPKTSRGHLRGIGLDEPQARISIEVSQH